MYAKVFSRCHFEWREGPGDEVVYHPVLELSTLFQKVRLCLLKLIFHIQQRHKVILKGAWGECEKL